MDGSTFLDFKTYEKKFPSLRFATPRNDEYNNVNHIKVHIDRIIETILSHTSLQEKRTLLPIFKDKKDIRTNPRFGPTSYGGGQDTLLEYCNLTPTRLNKVEEIYQEWIALQ